MLFLIWSIFTALCGLVLWVSFFIENPKYYLKAELAAKVSVIAWIVGTGLFILATAPYTL